MKTKFDHMLSTLEEKDKAHLLSVLPTRFMGAHDGHLAFLEMALSDQVPELEKTPVQQRLIMSDLYQMMEKFIVMRNSALDPSICENQLLHHFRQSENEKLFREKLSDSRRSLESQPLRNTAYYERKASLLYESWEFDQLQNRFSNSEADEVHRHKEIALISRQLMYTVSMAPQSAMIARQLDMTFADLLMQYAENRAYLDIPCIALYYYALRMIRYPEEELWFIRFSEGLTAHRTYFSDEELKTLYFQAINYCIRRHNLGDQTYSYRLLDYYRTALNERYLLTNGYLSRNTYRNINTIAIRLGLFDVALELSLSCVDMLRKEDKKSAYNFNMANIWYAQKKYNEAIDALQEVDFDDHLSNLFAKTILMKIYYETASDRLLDAHLDAMQVYLTRKKIIGYHKANYAKIIKYTRKLIRLNPYDRRAKYELTEKIKSDKLIPDREWLLRQVELKK